MSRWISCLGVLAWALLLSCAGEAQSPTPAIESQYAQNTSGPSPTPTRTFTGSQTPTPTSTATITRTPTVTPTSVEQVYPASVWHKITSALEAFPGLSLQRIVTETANAYFALASVTVQNTGRHTGQVTIYVLELPGGEHESITVDVEPGVHTIQLPYKFINLSTGWHTFSVSIAQSVTGPLMYQTSSFLGVWDISYALLVINQLREIYWSAGAMLFDGALCTAPQLGLFNAPYFFKAWYIACADDDSAAIYGDIKLPSVYEDTNITLSIEAKQEGTSTGVLDFLFTAYCVAENEAHTLVPALQFVHATTTNVGSAGYTQLHAETAPFSPTGDCATNPHLYWVATVDSAVTTIDMSEVRILGVTGNWNP